MKFKKYLGVILVVVLLIIGMIQLGVFANSVTKINFWMWTDFYEDPLWFDLVDEFNEAHSDIEVKLQLIPWDTFHEKLITAIAAGTAPEVSRVHVNWMGELAEMGALTPLDDFVAAWSGGNDVQEEIWDLLKIKKYGDISVANNLIFLPLVLSTNGRSSKQVNDFYPWDVYLN